MKKFIDVYLFQLKNLLRQKGFMYSTAIIVIFLFGSTFVTMKMNENTEKNTIYINVASDSKYALSESKFDPMVLDDYEFKFINDSSDEITKAINDGTKSDVFVISEVNTIPEINYYYKNTPKQTPLLAVQQQVQQIYTKNVSSAEHISDKTVELLFQPISVNHKQQYEAQKTFSLIYPFVFMMYMFILSFGQSIATNVTTEKSSRVMEVLLPKVSPIISLYSKILSSLTAGLIQFTVIISSVFLLKIIGWIPKDVFTILGFVIDLNDIKGSLFFWFVFLFIIGFLFYALLYAALGSRMNKVEELAGAMFPLILLQMAALGLGVFTIFEPQHIASVIAVYLPPFTPVVLFSRILLGEISVIQTIVALILFFSSTILITYFCQKWYREGVTSTNQKKSRFKRSPKNQ